MYEHRDNEPIPRYKRCLADIDGPEKNKDSKMRRVRGVYIGPPRIGYMRPGKK